MKNNLLNKEYNNKDDLESEGALSFYKRTLNITNISFSLDESITEPRYYRTVAEELMNLTENDSVQIRICSTGGRADGMITLIEAITNTDATVTCAIIGECHSAASIIALHCDQIYVAPYASMMCHNISYGTVGKDADVLSMVTHTSQWSKKLMRNTYSGFLTDKEITEMIDGKEFWFDSETIQERLTNREKHLVKEMKKLTKNKKSEVVNAVAEKTAVE